uniref:Uncharacterized protein n=1 Tax=Brassica oleracea var. oleracea TaxID=109376 RepID=A0A0D3CD13_BRAOL
MLAYIPEQPTDEIFLIDPQNFQYEDIPEDATDEAREDEFERSDDDDCNDSDENENDLGRKPAAPTYAQLFGDGSGTSSSGPSSSDSVPDSQTSQRVFSSPPLPPQMPPPHPPADAPQPVPEGAVHPDLRVPSYAPFARYTVFGANSCVSRSVSATIKGYYNGTNPYWSKTPNHVKITWFKCFAQKWHWSLGITERVKAEFVAKAKICLCNTTDEETARMKARMDSQQVRLDSLEDLLDVMAVGNPVMQRMLSERRAALGLPVRDPQEYDPTRQQPSNPTNYFEDM